MAMFHLHDVSPNGQMDGRYVSLSRIPTARYERYHWYWPSNNVVYEYLKLNKVELDNGEVLNEVFNI